MQPILVLYATREGHTRHVAEHVAATLRARDLPSTVVDVAHPPEPFDFRRFAAVLVAASVHRGQHEREMVRFVREHHIELEQLPTAFLSISLTEAGVEDPARSDAEHAAAAAEVRATVDAFLTETGWQPARILPVAGALLYRRYGVVTRLVMRMIAQRKGVSTDTSCDHVYTDWEALDRLVVEIAAGVEAPVGAAAAS